MNNNFIIMAFDSLYLCGPFRITNYPMTNFLRRA